MSANLSLNADELRSILTEVSETLKGKDAIGIVTSIGPVTYFIAKSDSGLPAKVAVAVAQGSKVLGALFIKRGLDGVSGRHQMFQKYKNEENENKRVQEVLDKMLSTPDGGTKSELLNISEVLETLKGSRNTNTVQGKTQSDQNAEHLKQERLKLQQAGKQEGVFCNRCGTKNPEDSAYCYNCGQKMATSSAPPQPKNNAQHQQPPESKAAPQPQRGENTPLHAALATHYGLFIGQSSYSDLERRFMSDVQDKIDRGVPLERDEMTLLHQITASTHLFFFTAVDRNGLTRFFDIMQGKDEFSVAETATTAPRLARCRETVYEVLGSAEFHHVHRNYGSYNKADKSDAFLAMNQFAKACGLTQVTKTAETLNPQEALPTWDGIFQGLGCPTRSFSFKSVVNFTE